jgi:hypothetical protein
MNASPNIGPPARSQAGRQTIVVNIPPKGKGV